MCNLNNKGDSTIKISNLDLFYILGGAGGGGVPFLRSEFMQIQKVISQLIFDILEKIFQLSTSLE